jgi:hypothetical protein
MECPQVTLDTNLLLEYWKQQDRRMVVERLIELARAGRVNLAVTARIRQDVPVPPLSEQLDRLSEIEVLETGAVARVGLWVIGRDILGDEGFEKISAEIDEELVRRGRRPPDWRDWDHVHAHCLSGRSVFLTWDDRILEVAPELSQLLGVIVQTPEAWILDVGL